MLPQQLLRVKTRKGVISPQFCGERDELTLAEMMVNEVNQAQRNGENRAWLEKRIAAIESDRNLGNDIKLVRGLYALLDRRCTYRVEKPVDSTGRALEPLALRKAVFEESAKRGFALTDLERKEIALAGAQRLGFALPSDAAAEIVRKAMFCDLEENQVLSAFEQITPADLIAWYNLALMQTLLFSCTRMEFSVSGGQNWRRILRRIKWLGLMYGLEEKGQDLPKNYAPAEEGSKVRHSGYDSRISCSLDGPLSLFKMTDRYGTSIAKLLPDIVKSEGWSLHAWVVRKTMSGKKLYEFHSSSSDVPKKLFDPYANAGEATAADIREQSSSHNLLKSSAKNSSTRSLYDSSVEEKFAKKVEQSSLPEAGWKLKREPDPLVIPGGGFIIPDFMFEKNGKQVYLEIVGFWTKEYLEKKTRKIIDILGKGESATLYGQQHRPLELFLAVNEDLACSKLTAAMPRERLIFYRNDSVPLGIIIDYLKSADIELLNRGSSDPELRAKIMAELEGSTRDIIAISEIANMHHISKELAVNVVRKIEQDNFIISENYLISKGKAKILADFLEGISRFVDASSMLSANSIPEACHAELVDKLGFSVLWKSIEPDSAVVVKRKPVP